LAPLTKINPFLHPNSVPPLERDIIAGAFAARVRSGQYGRRNQIKAGSVTDALAVVSKTIELAGQPSLFYRSKNKYQLVIERMVEGLRRTDAPTVPQLAVPVTVEKRAFTDAVQVKEPFQKQAGLLIMVAFYFLLRVCEYTQLRYVQQNGKRVLATRTKQFTVGNVGF